MNQLHPYVLVRSVMDAEFQRPVVDHGWEILFSACAHISGSLPMPRGSVRNWYVSENWQEKSREEAMSKVIEALRAVLPEMRREHDSGDGHFSTTEVEACEAALPLAEELEREVERLSRAVRNQIGDDLCWFDPKTVQIPPRSEFLESCSRYHVQIASERGELSGCSTIAQLEAECERLREEIRIMKTGTPLA